MRRKINKRLTSMLLAIAMVLTLVPTVAISAFAGVMSQDVILVPKVYKQLTDDTKYVVTGATGGTYSDIYIKDNDYPVNPIFYIKVSDITTSYSAYKSAHPTGRVPETSNGVTFTTFYYVSVDDNHAKRSLDCDYGFDDCAGTFVWDFVHDKWLFWCDNGGVINKEFYLYQYQDSIDKYSTKTVTADMISTESIKLFNTTSGETTVGSADVKLIITVDGVEYTIPSTEYTIDESNDKINPTDKDFTINIKYGNITKEVIIPYTCTIKLNNGGDTETTVYQTYGQGWYSDAAGKKPITEKATTLTLPTKDGYIFNGYYTEANGAGKQVITKDGYIVKGAESFFAAPTTLYVNWKLPPAEVNGIVNDKDDKAVLGAKVVLSLGNAIIAETTTEADGSYSFKDVEPGAYSIAITKDGKTVTSALVIDSAATGIVKAETTKLPAGNSNTIVDVKKDAPNTAVGGLDKSYNKVVADANKGYTEADKAVVEKGGSAEIKFTVEKATIEAEFGKDIAETAKNDKLTVGMFLNLSVIKTITDAAGKADSTKLIELPEVVTVYIDIPAELQGKATYVIYRYHDGNIDTITATPNDDGECVVPNADKTQLILKVRKFSTYSLAYSGTALDVKNASKPVDVKEESKEVVANTADNAQILAYALVAINGLGAAYITSKKFTKREDERQTIG